MNDRSKETRTVNGVFKGGGARGIAYVGALQAAEKKGLRFAAVAGSSAGAITAAMVAAGLSANEMEAATPAALKAIRLRVLRGFIPALGGALLDAQSLEEFLEGKLRERVNQSGSASQRNGAVTFEQLARASNPSIDLYVVAMDLATKQPVVFSSHTTPHFSVTAAVIASCAIPVVFTPRRVKVPWTDGTVHVHRLVDGGAWANYPAFVFNDPIFREHYGLPHLRDDVTTIGFLVSPAPSAKPAIRQLRDAGNKRSEFDLGSGGYGGILSRVISWSPFRSLLLYAFPLILLVISADWFRMQASAFFPVVRDLPPGAQIVAVVGLIAAGGILFGFGPLLIVLLYRLGREAFDVGLPAVSAALSVSTNVPSWITEVPSHPVVVLTYPEHVGTLSLGIFSTSTGVRDAAISTARDEADRQLDRILGRAPAELAQGSTQVLDMGLSRARDVQNVADEMGELGCATLIGWLVWAAAFAFIVTAILDELSAQKPVWAVFAAVAESALFVVLGLAEQRRIFRLARRYTEVTSRPVLWGWLALWTAALAWVLWTAGGSLPPVTAQFVGLVHGNAVVERVCCAGEGSNRFYLLELVPDSGDAYQVMDAAAKRLALTCEAGARCQCPSGAQERTCLVLESDHDRGLLEGDKASVVFLPATKQFLIAGEIWHDTFLPFILPIGFAFVLLIQIRSTLQHIRLNGFRRQMSVD